MTDVNGPRTATDESDVEEFTAVSLPSPLVERVERRVARTEFETTADYVAFVLEQVLARVETDGNEDAHEALDRAEVEERLQSLGYVD